MVAKGDHSSFEAGGLAIWPIQSIFVAKDGQ
jgi:hypothetical protein